MAARVLVFAFGAASYLCFLAVVLWSVAFVGDLGYVKTVDSGAPTRGWVASGLIDLALIAFFGLQHSTMARGRFKGWLTRSLPQAAERSVYVLASSVALAIVFAAWQPLAIAVWNHNDGWVHVLLVALFWIGWLMVLASTFLIDHFDLFGLRQVWLFLRQRHYTPSPFRDSWAYRAVRHPLMASFIVAFWATPRMTIGHAIFSAGMTAYILVGIKLEEGDLLRAFGSAYADYRQRVPMLLPGMRWSRK
jgi:protein-S-isoprenylcysteine O-methyltransferase Ste14